MALRPYGKVIKCKCNPACNKLKLFVKKCKCAVPIKKI